MRMRRSVTLAVLAAFMVTATGCSTIASWRAPSGTSTDAAGGGSIRWNACGAEALKLNPKLPRNLTAQCGTVTVPQNWTTAKDGKASDGKTFDIAVMRIRDNNASGRQGSVVMNPGGPGGSGVDYLPYLAGQLPDLLKRFDLVSFDPRGAGRAAPVDCIADADLDASFGYDPDPVTDASFQGAVTLSRKIADGCAAKYGASLTEFSTEEA